MAKCKLCKTNIPDGSEYCDDCLDKEKAKANESYLDSLLNSVKNSAPHTDSIYKKKNDSNPGNTEIIPDRSPETDFLDDDMFKFDIGDIEDFDQFNMEEDLSNLMSDEVVSDEDLFGVDLSEILTDEKTVNKPQTDKQEIPKIKEKPSELKVAPLETYSAEQEDSSKSYSNSASHNENIPKDDMITEEINNYNDEDGLDSDLNELLSQLGSGQNDSENVYDEEELQDVKKQDAVSDNSTPQVDNSFSDNADDLSLEDEDDFLSLLNQISSDDPVADDVKAINDLMKNVPASPSKGFNMPSDVGEVFSDALKAVSNLNDPNLDEAELLNKIPDKKSKKNKKEKKKKEKPTKNKKSSKKQTGEGTGGPKTGLFQRLFGNIQDSSSSKKGATQKKSSVGEGIEVLETAKGAKPKKGKKGKASAEEDQNIGKTGKATAADNEETEDKKGKKKAKKEKKQKSTNVIQVIDEIEEDVGRINRLGATIVFVFFGLLALLIYVGSNAVTYTLSIQHATSYFNKQKYTQAYEEVYGIKIEDEDVEIYSKIMTVMFVNKQLNSYNNYCAIKEYPQALDSLLKGLKRYDKYVELATMLGIKKDMNYVREQILAELKNQFNLSEKDALSINNIDDMKEYSLKIYDVALENK